MNSLDVLRGLYSEYSERCKDKPESLKLLELFRKLLDSLPENEEELESDFSNLMTEVEVSLNPNELSDVRVVCQNNGEIGCVIWLAQHSEAINLPKWFIKLAMHSLITEIKKFC